MITRMARTGWIATSVALGALLLGALATAQADVTIVRDGDQLTVPANLEAGYTTVSFANDSDQPYELTIIRLHEGVTVEQFEVLAEAASDGSGEAIQAILDAADIYGGVGMTPPGATLSVGVALAEGSYVASSSSFEGGVEARASFTVSGSTGAEAPAVDREVTMFEFGFGIEATIAAGEQTWRVRNVGQQLHHIMVFPIQPGTTLEDINEAMSQPGEPDFVIGPPALTSTAISGGIFNDLTFDLAPGSYAAICFVPDAETGMPHAALGMVAVFEVTGN